MEPISLQFIAESCDAELVNASGNAMVQRVNTDSRAVEPGDVFAAVSGERFDGHDFVSNAFGRGAVAAIVDREKLSRLPSGRGYLVVANARKALGDLGAAYRRRFDLVAVAIGGSNGKTSTKELVASVLRQEHEVTWSPASFNNDIGVPLTLLKVESRHRVGILEVGTNHPGELAPLLRMIQPRIGIITSIGREHLEYFGDIDGVIREEGALAEALPANGVLFLNGDTPGVEELSRRSRARVVRVGTGDRNDWRVRQVGMTAEGMSFHLEAPNPAYSGEYRMKILGMHQAVNGAFAAAIGEELGLGRAEIQRGLDSCTGAKARLQVRKMGEFTLLDDSYNANVDSMEAALRTLQAFPCEGRRIAVLGDMAELGATAEEAHREVGVLAATTGVDLLIAAGRWSEVVTGAARTAGLSQTDDFPGIDAATAALISLLRPSDVVLVKASRSSGLERLVGKLEAHFAEPEARAVR